MTIDMAPAAPEIEVSWAARLAHDGWVSEFEALRLSGENPNGGTLHAVPISARSGRSGRPAAARNCSPSGKAGGDPTKAMENLRAEIKLLHWHKLANEAALKAALLKTKKIKAQGGGTTKPVPAMTTLAMPTEERAAWMQQVIEEEQSKPLQVTKDYMSKYAEQEKENEGRLDTEVSTHIRSLRKLRQQIEKRGEMKARRVKYREAQRKLEIEKQHLLLGKVCMSNNEQASVPAEQRNGNGQAGPRQGAQKTVGALDTVLGSLDKLVELEKRISSLEQSNVYDNFRATKQGGAEVTTKNTSHVTGRRRTFSDDTAFRPRDAERPSMGARSRRLSFSKQKTEATVEAPSKVYYSVRMRRKARSVSEDSMARRRQTGNTARTARGLTSRAHAGMPSSRTRGGASTFLTQLPDVHRHTRAAVGRPGGRGGTRSAVADKKRLEAKRRVAGDRAEALRIARQDRIIREWMQRKKAAAATGCRQRKSSVLSASGTASAEGRRQRSTLVGAARTTRAATNVHLQEFRDIRAHYAKRTEKLRRDLSRRQKGPERSAFLAGTRTVAAARPRPALAASTVSSRPARVACSRPRLARGADVRRAAAATLRGATTATRDGMGAGRRVRHDVGLAVGGTGLRAARARQKEVSSFGGISSTRRRFGARPKHAVAILPRVEGVGNRHVGRGRHGGSSRAIVRW